MIDFKEKFANLMQELKDEKKDLEIKLQVAKLEMQEGWEGLQEKYANKDEWRVRMHLAKLEMEEEWDKLEEKLEGMKEKAGELVDVSEDKLHDGWETAKKLGDEVKEGIAKIREKI
jgi:hypothetical protein